MFVHFTYFDNSNPFIAITHSKFLDMICKYELRQDYTWGYYVVKRKEPFKHSYYAMKEVIRDFAIQWQANFEKFDYSYMDLANYQDFFTKYGKKYGLLNEFHENAIC